MSVSTQSPSTATLVADLARAPSERREACFKALLDAVWQGGEPTPQARDAVPLLVEEVRRRPTTLSLLLLGLLAGGGDPVLSEGVSEGLDHYLDLFGGADAETTTVLLYLLGNLPGERERILAFLEGADLVQADRARLERALAEFDPDHPDLGRAWPSPVVWRLNQEETAFDRGWIDRLTPEQARANWDNDTRTLLAYMGGRARWVTRTRSLPAPEETTVPDEAPGTGSVAPEASGEGLFDRFAGLLRCPDCREVLDGSGLGSVFHCPSCSRDVPTAGGIVDLLSEAPGGAGADGDDATAGLLGKLANMPSMGRYYEAVLRPSFLRVAGGNWGGAVTLADEDDYVIERVRPVEGPVLDLAAGAGRWTSVLAGAVGEDRVIALDSGLPMLDVLRRRLPGVPAVLGSALDLPFATGSLGAVNCWNALQAFPEEAGTAVREVGRCLRPGGTFTLMTFRWADDPLERHFQESHHFPSRPEGMLLFESEQLRGWLADAGMRIVDASGEEGFVFMTAVREEA
ncbi:class I SAM-dependent methyltransferase [Nocardiopsis quinghaiensis]|uniref:class I SAM-dependent methyltransferase n=1 Tax=Nocardiopsis quinghaiensis TaxID=464995 RepID=UPI001238526D|nr:class I SAM-dependent methyltransferase [Nocardiopsis quinghaiensis]